MNQAGTAVIRVSLDDLTAADWNKVIGRINQVYQMQQQQVVALKNLRQHSHGFLESLGSWLKPMARISAEILAIKYGMQILAQTLSAPFIFALKAVEDFKLAVLNSAAKIASLSIGKNMAENFAIAKDYVSWLIPAFDKMSAKLLPTTQEAMQIADQLFRSGVIIRQQDLPAFGDLANAVYAVAVAYPNKEVQIRQEIRGLLTGQLKQSNELAMFIDRLTNHQLKQMLQQWKQQGTVIQNLGFYLRAYALNASEYEATFTSLGSTLKSFFQLLSRSIFTDMYNQLTQFGVKATQWMMNNEPKIKAYFKGLGTAISDTLLGMAAGFTVAGPPGALVVGGAALETSILSQMVASRKQEKERLESLGKTRFGEFPWGLTDEQLKAKGMPFAERFKILNKDLLATKKEYEKAGVPFASIQAKLQLGEALYTDLGVQILAGGKKYPKVKPEPEDEAEKAKRLAAEIQGWRDKIGAANAYAQEQNRLITQEEQYQKLTPIEAEQKKFEIEQNRLNLEIKYLNIINGLTEAKKAGVKVDGELNKAQIQLNGLIERHIALKGFLEEADKSATGIAIQRQRVEIAQEIEKGELRIVKAKQKNRDVLPLEQVREEKEIKLKSYNEQIDALKQIFVLAQQIKGGKNQEIEAEKDIAEISARKTEMLDEYNYKIQRMVELQDPLKTFKKQWAKMTADAVGAGKQMTAMTETVAKSMTDTFSTFFFDVMKNKFHTLREYIFMFLNDISRLVSQQLAEQAVLKGIPWVLRAVGAVSGGGGEATSETLYSTTRAIGKPVLTRPVTIVQNITTSDANSFRRSGKQIIDDARRMMERS